MKLLSTTSTDIDAPRQPTHDEISQRARELWESNGRPADRDQDIWLEAERQLLAETTPIAMETAKASSAPLKPATVDEAEPSKSKPRTTTRARVPRGRAAS